MLADIYNKPVRLRQNFHSVGFGSFLLGATEMGIYRSLDDAAKTVVLPDQYLPNKQDNKAYMKYFKIFERLSTKLAPEFEEIANLQ
jgi:gluconokinase